MLYNAPPDQVARWARTPQDGWWYQLDPPLNSLDRPDQACDYPQLADGSRHWKSVMAQPVGSYTALLRAFGVEPFCDLCNCTAGCFDTHTTSSKHYSILYRHVEQNLEHVPVGDWRRGREDYWHETFVVGGCVRYNQLDGELQLRRDMPVLEMNVTRPEELPLPEQWMLVGAPAVVCVQPVADRTKWPNMWSHRHWKEKMQRAVVRACEVVAINGAANTFCRLCPEQAFCESHLLGPKHFGVLMNQLPETVPVQVDDFWQQWIVETRTGAMAFNHVDGTVRLLRRGDGSEPVVPVQPAVSTDPLERVWAAVAGLPQPPAPPPVQVEAAAPVAEAAVVSSGAELSPESLHPPAKSDHFMWCWQRNAIREVERLEQVLKTEVAGVGEDFRGCLELGRYCCLCHQYIELSDNFANHVVWDGDHCELIQSRFNQEGPNWVGWIQGWMHGRVLFNHLTLEITVQQHSELVTAGFDHRDSTVGSELWVGEQFDC
jgi:hypothetical protein